MQDDILPARLCLDWQVALYCEMVSVARNSSARPLIAYTQGSVSFDHEERRKREANGKQQPGPLRLWCPIMSTHSAIRTDCQNLNLSW